LKNWCKKSINRGKVICWKAGKEQSQRFRGKEVNKVQIGFNGASTMKTDLPGDIRAASRGGL